MIVGMIAGIILGIIAGIMIVKTGGTIRKILGDNRWNNKWIRSNIRNSTDSERILGGI